MTEKLVLVPGPDHPITIRRAEVTVTVRWSDRVIAKTDDALVLQESTYPPVYYLPLDSVDAEVLTPSTHRTYCPFKGDASYYSVTDGGDVVENAVWTYSRPTTRSPTSRGTSLSTPIWSRSPPADLLERDSGTQRSRA